MQSFVLEERGQKEVPCYESVADHGHRNVDDYYHRRGGLGAKSASRLGGSLSVMTAPSSFENEVANENRRVAKEIATSLA